MRHESKKGATDPAKALPGWKRDVGRRLDALIGRAVPEPVGCISPAVDALPPSPPGTAKYLHVHEGKPIDEEQLLAWAAKATKLPGDPRFQAAAPSHTDSPRPRAGRDLRYHRRSRGSER